MRCGTGPTPRVHRPPLYPAGGVPGEAAHKGAPAVQPQQCRRRCSCRCSPPWCSRRWLPHNTLPSPPGHVLLCSRLHLPVCVQFEKIMNAFCAKKSVDAGQGEHPFLVQRRWCCSADAPSRCSGGRAGGGLKEAASRRPLPWPCVDPMTAAVRFVFDGNRVDGSSSPADLDMEDGGELGPTSGMGLGLWSACRWCRLARCRASAQGAQPAAGAVPSWRLCRQCGPSHGPRDCRHD